MTKAQSEAAQAAQTLNRLFDIVMGFTRTHALAAGSSFGLFEAMADGPRSLEDLAGHSGLRPVACRRLLMALASLDLVTLDDDGQFRNTDLGQACTSKAPVNLGPLVRAAPFDRLCEYLPDALREYGPRWQQALGTTSEDTFASLYADPVGLRHFADMMDAMSIPQGQLIAESFDFTTCRCLMDVAGGPGGQSIPIGLKHPHLRGIVMDMEPVCVLARERIEAAGLGDRFTAIAADLTTGPYPEGADAVLLGHILHDWSDEKCRKILSNCARALPEGGTLLISESILAPDFSGRNEANLKDLVMLVANESDARERSEDEYRALLDEAGFDVVEIVRLEAPRDLMVAKKR